MRVELDMDYLYGLIIWFLVGWVAAMLFGRWVQSEDNENQGR